MLRKKRNVELYFVVLLLVLYLSVRQTDGNEYFMQNLIFAIAGLGVVRR